MSGRLKVMTVVGTRPEIIRLSRIIARLEASTDHVLVHTGQNYDYNLNQVFFDDLGMRAPDHYLGVDTSSLGAVLGGVLVTVEKAILAERPDALVVLGDTNSCIAALMAKRMKVPVYHLEAGNRSFDPNVPEEINRHLVDHVADYNLVYTENSRKNLLAEGLHPSKVILMGSPMREVLDFYRPQIDASDVLTRLGLTAGEYLLASVHREENVDRPDRLADVLASLTAVAKDQGMPLLVSTHPRTRKRIDALGIVLDQRVQLLKPLGFKDYNKVQVTAKAVLSDSGTINEESSVLNFPALNIREAHERPEGMEETSVTMVGLGMERVLQGLAILEDQPSGATRSLRQVADYSMPNVSDKVLRIIHSYTDYVSRVVWKRY